MQPPSNLAQVVGNGTFADPNAVSPEISSPDELSVANRVFLLSTIVLFFGLSLVSGRILLQHYVFAKGYMRLRTSSSGNGGGPNGSASASLKTSSGSYNTPKHGLNGSGSLLSQSTLANPAGNANATNAVPVTSSTALLEDESMASASTGVEMRRRFFMLLFLASTIRVCSLVVEITTLEYTDSPYAVYTRLLAFFIWLPSLLFLSMYGLVLLFWAQLCYACWGKVHPWPRRVFFVVNLLLYALFLVFLVVFKSSASFWRACDLMLGAIYFSGLFAILYYSLRLIYFFRNQGGDEELFFFDQLANANANVAGPAATDSPFRSVTFYSPRQIVLRRITAVCILLCVLFAVKGVYLFGMGSGLIASEEAAYRSPLGVHHIAFEFALLCSTEFLPCALMIYFTRRQRGFGSGASSPLHHASGNPNASPNTTMGFGSYRSLGSMSNTGGRPVTPNRNLRVRGPMHDPAAGVNDNLTGYQYQATQRAYGQNGRNASSGSSVNMNLTVNSSSTSGMDANSVSVV